MESWLGQQIDSLSVNQRIWLWHGAEPEAEEARWLYAIIESTEDNESYRNQFLEIIEKKKTTDKEKIMDGSYYLDYEIKQELSDVLNSYKNKRIHLERAVDNTYVVLETFPNDMALKVRTTTSKKEMILLLNSSMLIVVEE